MAYKNFFYLDLGFAIKKASGHQPLEKEYSILYSAFYNSETFLGKASALAISEKPEYYVSEEEEGWDGKFEESFDSSEATEGYLEFTDRETGCFVEAKFFASIALIKWTNEAGGVSLSCVDLTPEGVE